MANTEFKIQTNFNVREKNKTYAYWGLYNWPHTNLGCWNIQISTLKY